jgi:hypothetical protein
VLVQFNGTVTVAGNSSIAGMPVFTQAVHMVTYNCLFSVAICNMDGDERNDIATSYDGNNDPYVAIAVLRNTGAGASISMAAPQTLATDKVFDHVMAADLSGDGKPDLVANFQFAGALVVQKNSLPGQISTVNFPLTTTRMPVFSFSGDLDQYGRTDFVQLSNINANHKVILSKPHFSTEFRPASLVPNTGYLTPEFSSNTFEYTMAVAADVSKILFTAVPVSSLATMRMHVNNGSYVAMAAGVLSPELSQNPGSNKVDIEVKAESGIITILYPVIIKRSAAALQMTVTPAGVCIGSQVKFEANITNTGQPIGFSWYRNGQFVPDSTTKSFTVASFGKNDAVQCSYVYKEPGYTTTLMLSSTVYAMKNIFEVAVFVEGDETSSFFEPIKWLDYKVPWPKTHVIIPGSFLGLFIPNGSQPISIASLQVRPSSYVNSRVPITITGNCPVLPDQIVYLPLLLPY